MSNQPHGSNPRRVRLSSLPEPFQAATQHLLSGQLQPTADSKARSLSVSPLSRRPTRNPWRWYRQQNRDLQIGLVSGLLILFCMIFFGLIAYMGNSSAATITAIPSAATIPTATATPHPTPTPTPTTTMPSINLVPFRPTPTPTPTPTPSPTPTPTPTPTPSPTPTPAPPTPTPRPPAPTPIIPTRVPFPITPTSFPFHW